jgi:ComF family protein
MRQYLNALTAVFYPNVCVHCKQHHVIHVILPLCFACAAKVRTYTDSATEFKVPETLAALSDAVNTFSALWYFEKTKPVQTLIECIKYGHNPVLAKQMGMLLWQHFESHLRKLHIDAILPMPISNLRKRQRGYNQAELLGKVISKQLGIPLLNTAIFRKPQQSQTRLGRSHRFYNTEGAFHVKTVAPLQSKNILILDDVCTTGATLEALINTWDKNTCKTIHVLVLAYTPRQ